MHQKYLQRGERFVVETLEARVLFRVFDQIASSIESIRLAQPFGYVYLEIRALARGSLPPMHGLAVVPMFWPPSTPNIAANVLLMIPIFERCSCQVTLTSTTLLR
ncbi:hypothetical protein [Burkholderia contaminans]|uniref:hypothetical protein n=1 Tax=Burkholderia contaminans TaxID=488447 RepID=UPI001582F01A|nr:hypothetical protein [Burkholderia contaminans]